MLDRPIATKGMHESTSIISMDKNWDVYVNRNDRESLTLLMNTNSRITVTIHLN